MRMSLMGHKSHVTAGVGVTRECGEAGRGGRECDKVEGASFAGGAKPLGDLGNSNGESVANGVVAGTGADTSLVFL